MRHGLLVLALGERVDRAELLAAAHQPLDARRQPLALLVGQRLRRRLGLEAQAAGQLVQVALGVGRRVAHLLRGHLGARHGLARLLEAALELCLLLRARLQRGGGLLAGGRAGLELARERVAAGRDGLARAVERGGGALGVGGQLEVALDPGPQGGERARPVLALALDALREPLLGAQVAEQLGAPDRLGAVLRRLAAARDEPLGAARGLLGLGGRAQSGAQLGLRGLARGVRLGNGTGLVLDRGARLRLVAHGVLGRGDQLVAPGQLLEQPLRAAHRRLRELAGAGVEEPPGARDGDAAEGLGKRTDRFHDPHAREQPLGERRDVPPRDAQVAQVVARLAPKGKPERQMRREPRSVLDRAC